MKFVILAVLTMFDVTPFSDAVEAVQSENTQQTTEHTPTTSMPRGIQG